MDAPLPFELTTEPIDPAALAAEATHASCGAFVSFEGWVRDHNEGKAVRGIAYEAYAKMALKEGARIVEEVREELNTPYARCVHRTGDLVIGDCAVWVGVSAAHRGEAFAACRRIIDAIKHRVPIWKKESYSDGDSGWVNCERCAHHAKALAPSPSDYYARQMVLPEVGPEGQARLKLARVLVVGAGGLGCGALPYLAAAGVGRLGIVDGDRIELHNLHRQVLFSFADVGQSKAETAAKRLLALNPLIQCVAHAERLEPGNVEALLRDYEVVLDCTDDLATKFLLNDACVALGKTLLSASIHQYEGHLFVYQPASSAACLRCLWNELPMAGPSCAEAGVLGAVPGVFGSMQAAETLKSLLGLPGQLRDELLLFDLFSMRARRIRIHANETCPACAGESASTAENLEVDFDAARSDGFRLIDMREAAEAAREPVADWEHWPLEDGADRTPPFAEDERVALLCERGLRSRVLAHALRERGYREVYSVRGGTRSLPKIPAPP